MRAGSLALGAIGGVSALALVNEVSASERPIVAKTKEGISKAGKAVSGGLRTMQRVASFVYDKSIAVFGVMGELVGATIVATMAVKVVSLVVGPILGISFGSFGAALMSFTERTLGWVKGLLSRI